MVDSYIVGGELREIVRKDYSSVSESPVAIRQTLVHFRERIRICLTNTFN